MINPAPPARSASAIAPDHDVVPSGPVAGNVGWSGGAVGDVVGATVVGVAVVVGATVVVVVVVAVSWVTSTDPLSQANPCGLFTPR